MIDIPAEAGYVWGSAGGACPGPWRPAIVAAVGLRRGTPGDKRSGGPGRGAGGSPSDPSNTANRDDAFGAEIRKKKWVNIK